MPWLQLNLITTESQAEAVGDALTEIGALSISLMDAEDIPILEPAPGETPLWRKIKMMILFDATIDTDDTLAIWNNHSLSNHTDNEKFELIEDKDWEREWMDRFEPMRFGKRLWICPSWKPIQDEKAVNVLLDPGLAFGTGTHPTTALCLTWLDSIDLTDKTLVDYGCGSGILAIAALKLGAKKVYAVDIDPQALLATKENAARNDIEMERLVVSYPSELGNVCSDILVANILAGPLVSLAGEIAKHCSAEAHIALSGILDTQAMKTREAYLKWFKMEQPVYKEEWSLLTGIKTFK